METNDIENSSRIASPRFTEVCRRYRDDESDLLGQSEKPLLGKEIPPISKERHEDTKHRLLLEVRQART